MKNYKYIILGAGPSGLAFARTLKDLGEDSFLLLEKETEPGGLCRSVDVDGSPLDLGGGHFLDVKSREVLDFIFRFMPQSEWREFRRDSKLLLKGAEVDYPLEAHIWQLPIDSQIDYLESIAQAGCARGLALPDTFEEWISWKLGEKIAAEYMLPYNRKIWSVDLNTLGTYWLNKLPDVSFRQILQSCLERRGYGTIPAHGKFLYPAVHGYGEVWKRIGGSLEGHLLTSTPVTSVDLTSRTVNGSFQAGKIISTIPWSVMANVSELPDGINKLVGSLQHSSIDIDYVAATKPTSAHWIYEPDESISYHRILCRSNFCSGSRGYWTETNSARNANESGWRHHNEFAYPINTVDKPRVISEIASWAELNGILCMGRWGKWEHMNSDVAVAEGISAAKNLVEHEGRLS